jgi:hypothetical protein
MNAFDWRTFLTEWSRELLALKDLAAELPPEVVASGWLGYPGATQDQLTRAEAHLGRALGRLRDKRALKSLIALLQDPCEQVRSSALGAFSRLNALANLRDPPGHRRADRGAAGLAGAAQRRGRHWGDMIAVALAASAS